MANYLFLAPVFFLIAVLYSMVGLGGGSAYITAMVFAGIPKETFPVIALLCNLLVASQGALRFKKAGHFRWKLFWPFAVTAIPLAYLGGRFQISEKLFMAILACALFLAAVRLLFTLSPLVEKGHPPLNLPAGRQVPLPSLRLRSGQAREGKIIFTLAIGAALGLLAGITGIGGGIYLIPVLIFLRLATPHEASAVAGPFIVVNSIAGLLGQFSKGCTLDWQFFLPLAAAVIIGGYIGSKTGATKLKAATLQKIVGIIMMIAVAKLVWGLL